MPPPPSRLRVDVAAPPPRDRPAPGGARSIALASSEIQLRHVVYADEGGMERSTILLITGPEIRQWFMATHLRDVLDAEKRSSVPPWLFKSLQEAPYYSCMGQKISGTSRLARSPAEAPSPEGSPAPKKAASTTLFTQQE